MIEIILLVVALAGSTLAGIIDLKTTEIPNWIPYVMIIIGIVGNLVRSILTGSYTPILMSVGVGLGYLLFGFMMYFAGQWGGGDAKILSGIGFLIPTLSIAKSSSFQFYLGFFFNVFFVGAIYMILYIFIISFINKKVWKFFFKSVKKSKKILYYIGLMIFILSGFSYFSVYRFGFFSLEFSIKFGVTILLMVISMFLLWKFAKVVEEVGFKKKISISKLKEGDVPADFKVWEGVTKEQIKKMKKSGKKYIWIKEGVRFAPAFPLAIIFTIYLGEGFIWLINLIN